MRKKKEDNNNLIKFAATTFDVTEYRYNKGTQLISWGKDNISVPKSLLAFYNSEGKSLHKSLINKKVKFIAGNGLHKAKQKQLQEIIGTSDLDKEIKKATFDFELFNGFAFEVIKNKAGELHSIKHIPFHKLRLKTLESEPEEVDDTLIWFSHDWENKYKQRNVPVSIPLFDNKIKHSKSIFYYSEYNPETDGLYPIPSYSQCLRWINLAHKISVFHYNQVHNGYSPSMVISFNNGMPSPEVQQQNYDDLNDMFAGETNSGGVFITYSSGIENKPQLIPVQLNDSDKRFLLLNEQITDEVISAHEIPPALVKLEAGKLASTDERRELNEEFQYSYVDDRQHTLESAINEILVSFGIDEKVKLKTYKDARAQTNDLNNKDVEDSGIIQTDAKI